MKRSLLSLLFSAAAISASGADAVSIDFENGAPNAISKDFGTLETKNPISGKSSLVADATGKKNFYTPVMLMHSGLLKPFRNYKIEFDYRVLKRNSPGCHFQYFLRSTNARAKDLYTMQFGSPESDGKTGRVSFFAPIDNTDDYALCIGMFGQGAIQVDNVRIVPLAGKETGTVPLFSASQNIPALPAIPGGAEFEVSLPENTGRKILRAEQFGMNPKNADNTDALNRALKECRKTNASQLLIPLGVYRFKNSRSVELTGLKNLLIDGSHSEFILSDATPGEFIWLRGCERVELRNLTVDWDWDAVPLASRITVVEQRASDSSVLVQFQDYDRVPVTEERMRSVNGDKRTDGNHVFTLFDNLDLNRSRVHAVVKKVEYPGGNKVRLFLRDSGQARREFHPGRRFRLRHFFMSRKAFKVDDCTHLTFRNVGIYSVPGAGFVFKRATKYVQLLDCFINWRPGRDPLITSTGDHFHQIYTQGYFKLDGCIFRGGGDDMINFKGVNAWGVRKTGEKELLAGNVLEWQMQFEKGNIVELKTSELKPIFCGEIEHSVYDKKEKAFRLTFKNALPETLPYYTVVSNKSYNSDHFIVRNCIFSDGEAQGILAQVSDGLIENCVFSDLKGPALQFTAGYSLSWSEGDSPVRNIVVRNNRFTNCNRENRSKFGNSETVYLGMYSFFGISRHPVIENILFENNRFEDTTGLAFQIAASCNIVIRNNYFGRFIHSGNNLFPNDIQVRNSSGIFVLDNSFSQKDPVLLKDGVNSGIFISGNRKSFFPISARPVQMGLKEYN